MSSKSQIYFGEERQRPAGKLSKSLLFTGVHVTLARPQELKPKKILFKKGLFKCNSEQQETRKKSSCNLECYVSVKT